MTEIVDRVLHFDPPSPSRVSQTVTSDIDAIVKRALEKNPGCAINRRVRSPTMRRQPSSARDSRSRPAGSARAPSARYRAPLPAASSRRSR